MGRGPATRSAQPRDAERGTRWMVLGAGSVAQAANSAVTVGIVVLAPLLRETYGLSLGQLGVALAAQPAGFVVTALAWGLLSDRIGERAVIAAGLSGSAALLLLASLASSFGLLLTLLFGVGLWAASVSAASGRAIMQWFPPWERGLALGIRQAAVPLGGFMAAIALPLFGLSGAFVALAAANLAAAGVALAIVRERPGRVPAERRHSRLGPVLRDPTLQRLCVASALLSTGQVCMLGFSVVFLADEAGVSPATGALTVAAMQIGGISIRIASGRWSDRRQRRFALLHELAVAVTGLLIVTAFLHRAGASILVPLVIVAGSASLGWNALSFTAAAETSGAHSSGTALGLQQMMLALWAAAAAPLFGLVVAAVSWRVGLIAVAVLTAVAAWMFRGLSLRELKRDNIYR